MPHLQGRAIGITTEIIHETITEVHPLLTIVGLWVIDLVHPTMTADLLTIRESDHRMKEAAVFRMRVDLLMTVGLRTKGVDITDQIGTGRRTHNIVAVGMKEVVIKEAAGTIIALHKSKDLSQLSLKRRSYPRFLK